MSHSTFSSLLLPFIAFVFYLFSKWLRRTTRREKSHLRRLIIHSVYGLIFLFLLSSFHCFKITYLNKEQVKWRYLGALAIMLWSCACYVSPSFPKLWIHSTRGRRKWRKNREEDRENREEDKRRRKQKMFHFQEFFLSFCVLIFVLLFLYFSCKITYQNEEQVKRCVATKCFFKCLTWKEFVNVMKGHWWREVWSEIVGPFWQEVHRLKELWSQIVGPFRQEVHRLKELWSQIVGLFWQEVHGWYEVWNQIVEVKSFKVLGLSATATQQEITSRYRKLSQEWHPDKHKDPEAKRGAQEKFVEIQQAYEIVSNIKSHRVVQNIRNPESQNLEDHQEL